MIVLGSDDDAKPAMIAAMMAARGLRRIVVIAPERYPLAIAGADQVRYADVIMYTTYYRLLQEIDGETLIVLNECLRTQNRYSLEYNCIRNFLNQTPHVAVFQYLPQIDTAEDLMILFDFVTRSRWKRRGYDPALIAAEADVHVTPRAPVIAPIAVPTRPATRAHYAATRARLFAELGAGDPHTLPRQLALLGGGDKLAYIRAHATPLFGDATRYVARNARLKHPAITTYDQVHPGQEYTLVEFPHRFLDFCDFVTATRATTTPALIADLPVDHWYARRYTEWTERLNAAYADLSA